MSYRFYSEDKVKNRALCHKISERFAAIGMFRMNGQTFWSCPFGSHGYGTILFDPCLKLIICLACKMQWTIKEFGIQLNKKIK